MATDIPFVYVLDGAAANVVRAILPIVDCGHYAIALEGPTNIGFVSIDFVIGLAYELHKFGVWHLEVPAQTGAVGVDMGRNIWQSEHPVSMIKAVRAIVHGNQNVDQAFKLYKKLVSEESKKKTNQKKSNSPKKPFNPNQKKSNSPKTPNHKMLRAKFHFTFFIFVLPT